MGDTDTIITTKKGITRRTATRVIRGMYDESLMQIRQRHLDQKPFYNLAFRYPAPNSLSRALGHHGDKHCELTRETTKVSNECFLEPECHEECVPKQHEKCHNEQASMEGVNYRANTFYLTQLLFL